MPHLLLSNLDLPDKLEAALFDLAIYFDGNTLGIAEGFAICGRFIVKVLASNFFVISFRELKKGVANADLVALVKSIF